MLFVKTKKKNKKKLFKKILKNKIILLKWNCLFTRLLII